MSGKKWSAGVDETSRTKELPEGLFTRSAEDIASTLKKVVDNSDSPHKYESAMSMLDFYINRAGSNLTPDDRARLDRAKEILRNLYNR